MSFVLNKQNVGLVEWFLYGMVFNVSNLNISSGYLIWFIYMKEKPKKVVDILKEEHIE